jgi:hypothetical protein
LKEHTLTDARQRQKVTAIVFDDQSSTSRCCLIPAVTKIRNSFGRVGA